MKTVVFNSPYYDQASFSKAQVTLKRGEPTLVSDEQAEILLNNPDVTLSNAPSTSAPTTSSSSISVSTSVSAAAAASIAPSSTEVH